MTTSNCIDFLSIIFLSLNDVLELKLLSNWSLAFCLMGPLKELIVRLLSRKLVPGLISISEPSLSLRLPFDLSRHICLRLRVVFFLKVN